MNKKIILFLVAIFLLASFTFADKRSEEFVDRKIAEIQADPEYDNLPVYGEVKKHAKDFRDYAIQIYKEYRKHKFPYYGKKDKPHFIPYKEDGRSRERFSGDNMWIFFGVNVFKDDIFTEIDLKWNYMVGFDSLKVMKSERNHIIKKLQGEVITTSIDSSRIFYYLNIPEISENKEKRIKYLTDDYNYLEEILTPEEKSQIYKVHLNRLLLNKYFCVLCDFEKRLCGYKRNLPPRTQRAEKS